MRARGHEPVRLTTDGTLKLTPVFSNKGDEVVFATHEVPNLVAIVRLKLSDGSRRRLHPTVVNHQFDPAFSIDGRLHAYARSSTSPQMVLVIQDTHEKKESVFRPREWRDRAEPFVRARRLAQSFSLSESVAIKSNRSTLTPRPEAFDRHIRNERLAGVFARRHGRSLSARAGPVTSKST